MTEKLKNIYSDLNYSSEGVDPSSNIIQYNKIMANDENWRKKPENRSSQGQEDMYHSKERRSDMMILDS